MDLEKQEKLKFQIDAVTDTDFCLFSDCVCEYMLMLNISPDTLTVVLNSLDLINNTFNILQHVRGLMVTHVLIRETLTRVVSCFSGETYSLLCNRLLRVRSDSFSLSN